MFLSSSTARFPFPWLRKGRRTLCYRGYNLCRLWAGYSQAFLWMFPRTCGINVAGLISLRSSITYFSITKLGIREPNCKPGCVLFPRKHCLPDPKPPACVEPLPKGSLSIQRHTFKETSNCSAKNLFRQSACFPPKSLCDSLSCPLPPWKCSAELQISNARNSSFPKHSYRQFLPTEESDFLICLQEKLG